MGENVRCAQDQNDFRMEIRYSTDMIPAIKKNINMCIVPLWFGESSWWGKGWLEVFSTKRNMVGVCGYWEVKRVFLVSSSEIWFNIYIGTDNRDLVKGNRLYIYTYIYIYIYIYPFWHRRCHLLASIYIHWHCTKLAHNL